MGKIVSTQDFDRMCRENNVLPLAYFSGVKDDFGRYITYKFKCSTCDTVFSSRIYDNHIRVCPVCKKEYRSQRERVLSNYIKSLGYNVVESDRSILNGYELDLYVPDKSVAFEINGIVYHSTDCNHGRISAPKEPDYHLKKTLLALSKGVYVYHLWDYDSIDAQKLLIKNALQGELLLTTWVDKNPSLAPYAELMPLYYVTADSPPYHKGLHVSKPRTWSESSVVMYEFYNAGFCRNK